MNENKYPAPVVFILALILLAGSLPAAGCRQQAERTREETGTARAYDGTIIALGDSLTAGLGVAMEDAWPARLQEMLHEAGYDWEVINAGISGETSSGALSRLKWIISREPGIVILQTGSNDGLRGIPPEVIEENIDRSVRMLRENDITVVLAGMHMVRNLGREYTEAFARIYPAVAARHDVLLIPFLLEGVGGEPALNLPDTIHPNERGHAVIARTVFPYAVQAIERRKQTGGEIVSKF
jgi:acyl-CoA thioesterase-1